MKNSKILAILVMALSLMVCFAQVGHAEPMGTAWTYQGRLMDANGPADGLYDFRFKLYDNPDLVFAAQQGAAIDVNDLDVIDGYFTVELDFGSGVFDGNARWLEVGVRPGEMEDPNAFMALTPRQEVTPVPYALQTRGIFVDDAGNVGIGTTNPTRRLTIDEGGLSVFAGSSGETVAFSTGRFYITNNDEDTILDVGESPSDYVTISNGGSKVMAVKNNGVAIGGYYTSITPPSKGIIVEGNVGIGTDIPGAKLDVEVTSGGAATIGSSTNSATGGYAIAMGMDTTAGGYASTAIGYSTTASEAYSTAMGYMTDAIGSYSTAMGSYTTAGGYASTAMGHMTDAIGSYSTAMGYDTNAVGDGSTAMGHYTNASGYASTAMGLNTTASGDSSTAMGHYTNASGGGSTAMGRGIEAAGQYSVAIALADMEGAQVTQDNTMAILGGNVGIGTSAPGAKLDVEAASGPAATIGSSTNSATGDYAVAIGRDTTASGDGSTAMGYNTTAGGDASTAMGAYTTANGLYSTAMGEGTTAGQSRSTAMGYMTDASGYTSTAMGVSTTASGSTSTAMGFLTTASGSWSTAMGYGTTASGLYSTAMGYGIEAAGQYSVAIGLAYLNSTVTQNNTMAIMGGNVGIGTTTPSRVFFVSGTAGGTTGWYNDSDSRLKKDIATIDNALEKVNKLRGVEFEWKDPDNYVEGRQIGFIGQETVEVVPEVVDVKDGRYSMQYAPLTALLVEAIKELQSENDELQEQNNRLESRLSALENAMRSGSSIGKGL